MFKRKIATELLLIIVFCYNAFAQDFEPDPLEVTTAQISTDRPNKPTIFTTTAITIDVKTTTVETSTVIPTSTLSIETTTIATSTPESMDTTTKSPTTTIMMVTQKPQINLPSTTSMPYHPNMPTQTCYFRKQQGMLQHFWTCEGLKWGYNIECYYCCRSENSMIAGCNRVSYNYCEYYYY